MRDESVGTNAPTFEFFFDTPRPPPPASSRNRKIGNFPSRFSPRGMIIIFFLSLLDIPFPRHPVPKKLFI